MTKERIAILGCCGAVGSLVAREILETTKHRLVVAGRNLEAVERMAGAMGDRVEGRFADALDRRSLLDLLSGVALVVNCTGPVDLIGASVAAAALESDTHYVDIVGSPPVMGILRGWQERLLARQIIFCTAAGLFPGLSGVMMESLAQGFDRIDSAQLSLVYSDDLKNASARDLALEIMGSEMAVYGRKGWEKPSIIRVFKRVSFPDPFGVATCFPGRSFELDDFPVSHAIQDFALYCGAGSPILQLAFLCCWLMGRARLKNREARAAGLLQTASRIAARRGPRGAAMMAEALGQKNGRTVARKIEIVCDEMYGATVIPAAAAVRMILDGELRRRGAFYLREGVDPSAFMESVSSRGLKYEIHEHG